MLDPVTRESACEFFKRRFSISYSTLGPLDISPIRVLSSSLWCRSQGCRGACCRTPAPHFSEKSTALVRCLPTGCQCARDRVFCQDVSLPVLFISIWSFCPLLWRNSSSCFQVFFREKWPICSCRFAAPMGGSEFRVFLYYHSGLFYKNCFGG